MSETTPGSKKEALLNEFNAIVSETERLLKAAHPGSGTGGSEVSSGFEAKVDENLKAARERLELLEDALLERAKTAMKTTDTFVRANPWQAVGIATGIGLLIGMLLRRR